VPNRVIYLKYHCSDLVVEIERGRLLVSAWHFLSLLMSLGCALRWLQIQIQTANPAAFTIRSPCSVVETHCVRVCGSHSRCEARSRSRKQQCEACHKRCVKKATEQLSKNVLPKRIDDGHRNPIKQSLQKRVHLHLLHHGSQK